MKSYIAVLLLLVIFVAGLFGSCKKFLSEKQVSNLTQDYYNTEEGFECIA